MPELPEVNTVMKGFRSTVLHDKILEVSVRDSKIIRNCTAEYFSSALLDKHFIDTYRQGKYFFGVLDSGISILFHLGMTGDIVYYRDEIDAPRHERFYLRLASGMILGYDDPRKFSRILVVEDRMAYLEEINLGPDALRISQDDFLQIFEGRRSPVKSLLMNQQLISGIGNLYADEICFQARLHPASTALLLDKKDRQKLFRVMRNILTLACDRDAYYKVYPADWFWQWRRDDAEIPGKGPVGKIKIGGRTTYYIEGYQKMVSDK